MEKFNFKYLLTISEVIEFDFNAIIVYQGFILY